MAKRQTRRSVSIRGVTYDRIRNHCRLAGVSMSEFVEDQITTFFSHPGERPRVARPESAQPMEVSSKVAVQRPKKSLSTIELQDAARTFTF